MGLSKEVQSWSFLSDGSKTADSQSYDGVGKVMGISQVKKPQTLFFLLKFNSL